MSHFLSKVGKALPNFYFKREKGIFFNFLLFLVVNLLHKKDSSLTTEHFALLCCRMFLKVSYSLNDSLN